MCGLVGLFGDYSVRGEQAFADMLQMDVIRGSDSAGVAVIRKNRTDVLKGTWLPTDLVESEEYSKLNAGTDMVGWIGHNRAATKGNITEDNAHPFQVGPITLAHNGTLHTMWNLPDHQKFESDSHCITNSIATIGIRETWKNLQGAAALTWWNAADQTLNLITNGDRPLAIGLLENKKGVAWASESWMFRAALGRRELKLARLENGMDAVHILDKNVLVSFKWNKKKNELMMSTEKLEPWSYQPIRSKHYTSWPNDEAEIDEVNQDGLPFVGGNRRSSVPITKTQTDNGKVLPFPGVPKDTEYSRLPAHERNKLDEMWSPAKACDKKTFHELYKNGCVFCGGGLDFETAVIVDDNTAVCGECSEVAKNCAMNK